MGEVLFDFNVVVVVDDVVHLSSVLLVGCGHLRHLARRVLLQTVVLLYVLVVWHQDFVLLVEGDPAVLQCVNDFLPSEVAHQKMETQVLWIVLLLAFDFFI